MYSGVILKILGKSMVLLTVPLTVKFAENSPVRLPPVSALINTGLAVAVVVGNEPENLTALYSHRFLT